MSNSSLQAVVLAAGKSTRFNTGSSKLATKICGREMILHCTKLLEQVAVPTTLVVGHQRELIKDIVRREHGDAINFVVQEEQKGTGHAVLCSRDTWHAENLLILNGDGPLITPEILENAFKTHQDSHAAITFVTTHNPDPSVVGYGRVITEGDDIQIIEQKHFTGDPQEHCCLNAGIYLVDTAYLQEAIDQVQENDVTHEWYLTDLIHLASEQGRTVKTVDAPFDRIRGVNTLKELWVIEQVLRCDLITNHMNNGVRFGAPQTVHLDLDVTIGAGSVIGCSVHLLQGSSIGKNCTIDAFSTIKNAHIQDNAHILQNSIITNSIIEQGAQVGPFAHIRNSALVKKMAVIGNFVEVSKSTVGQETKAKHLTYLGNATIGDKSNIGAGTIVCNYNGVTKHTTTIGDNAFIGSNNTLVAPVTVENGAYTAAGSVITQDVPTNALGIARSRQTNKEGYAQELKQRSLQTKKIFKDTSTQQAT